MSRAGAVALRPLPRWLSTTACVAVAVGIVGVARQIALFAPFSARPPVVVGAVTTDLMVTLPLVCWWMLAREYRWSPLALLPLYFGALVVAGRVLPADERQALLVFHALAAPLEILSVWLFVRRARQPGRLGEALRYEVSVLRHAFGGAPAVPSGAGTFTVHRKTAYGAIVFALLLATAVEVPAMHFLVGLWSHKVAWALTALGVYGVLWVVGDWRAVRACPVRLDGDMLRVRFGLRWRVDVPVARIVRIRPPTPEEKATKRGVDLRLTLPGAPMMVLELDRAAQAEGIYGLRRPVRTLGLGVDEPELFKEAVAAAKETPNPEHR